jgi:hypothetical protein
MSEKLKRYLVFAGENYYAAGGWWDFRGSFDDLEEARLEVKGWTGKMHWTQIVDIETGEEVPS